MFCCFTHGLCLLTCLPVTTSPPLWPPTYLPQPTWKVPHHGIWSIWHLTPAWTLPVKFVACLVHTYLSMLSGGLWILFLENVHVVHLAKAKATYLFMLCTWLKLPPSPRYLWLLKLLTCYSLVGRYRRQVASCFAVYDSILQFAVCCNDVFINKVCVWRRRCTKII